jgi:hypothetical protein
MIKMTHSLPVSVTPQCIAFGGGYFAKVITKKALSEVAIRNGA